MLAKLSLVVFILTALLYYTGDTADTTETIRRALEPLDYDLSLDVNLKEKEHFSGTVSIKVKCVAETNEIVLNVKDLNINESTVKVEILTNQPTSKKDLRNISEKYENKEKESYMIILETDLRVNDIVLITLQYDKMSSTSDTAFIKYSYKKDPNGKEKLVALTKSGAFSARRLFPCVDEVDWKVEVSLQITHNKDLVCLSNTDAIDDNISWRDNEKFITKKFRKTERLSMFSIGFVIGDFKYTEDKSILGEYSIRVWMDETVDKKQSTHVATNTLMIVRYYEIYFDKSLAVKKIDIVALPNYDGVDLLTYGLITFEESLITGDKRGGTKVTEITWQLCYAICHQYFGPQTTFSRWSENWLNMGFARFFRINCLREDYRNIAVTDQVESFIRVLNFDEEMKLHTLMRPDSIIHQTENAIFAEKAYFLVRMINFFLGNEILLDGVKKYIQEYAFEVLSLEEMWNILQDKITNKNILPSDITVKHIMDSWDLKKGVPTIKITQKRNQIIITQQESDYIIPLNFIINNRKEKYSIEEGARVQHWLKTEPIQLEVNKNDWIILHTELNVLCRVEYDKRTLELLGKILSRESYDDILPNLSRVQLIADIFASAERGKCTYKYVFDTMKYLQHERSHLPFIVALNEFNKISLRLLNSDINIYTSFLNYMQMILKPVCQQRIKDMEWTNLDDNFYGMNYFKKLIATWASYYQVEDCIPKRDIWFESNTSTSIFENEKIPEELREVYYCAEIRKNQDTTWHIAFRLYKQKFSRNFNRLILKALTCTPDNNLLTIYLKWSIDPNKIAPEDSFFIFESLASTPNGYCIMRNFFEASYDEILKQNTGDPSKVYRYLQKLYELTGTEDEFNKLNDITNEIKNKLENVEDHLKASKQIAMKNISWLKKYAIEVSHATKNAFPRSYTKMFFQHIMKCTKSH